MIVGQEKLFMEQVDSATRRYRDCHSSYEFKRAQLQGGSFLQMDSPARITEWMLRSARVAVGESGTGTVDRVIQERILGRSDLLSVQFFAQGAMRAKSVGRVLIRSGGALRGYGTGFLVSPRLMMTNNHVLPSAAVAAGSQIQMNYQIGVDGKPVTPAVFGLRPDQFFLTSTDLDFTLVAVEPVSDAGAGLGSFGFVRIIEQVGKVVEGRPLNIIQHPSGQMKQIAVRENDLIHLLDQFLHYETDTAPGSSGSPVFSDMWELVGLHHAGVPKQNSAGDMLARDGTVWTPAMGEEQIDWIANEGVRASELAKAVKAAPGLDAGQKKLRAGIFESLDAEPTETPEPAGAPLGGGARIASDGTITWSFPIEFSVKLPVLPDVMRRPGTPPAPPPAVIVPPSTQPSAPADAELRKLALAQLEASTKRKYYDKPADIAAAKKYYAGIKANQTKKALYSALSKLVRSTHLKQLPYKPAIALYPWVDLQPPAMGKLKVRSVYSGTLFDARDFIENDLVVEATRAEMASRLTASALFTTESLEESGVLEATAPFNCEHVVPQSWFAKKNPMRGDLHHLFSCESGCNSFRGNTPYFDFPDFEEAIRQECGKREQDKFEPGNGKGEVARATLYFLLRYPGQIGKGFFAQERIAILLTWHAAHPVSEFELHRNAAIFESQGNRNPLIDHPEWAAKIDFSLGLTSKQVPEESFTDAELLEKLMTSATD